MRSTWFAYVVVGCLAGLLAIMPAAAEGACWVPQSLTATPADDLEPQWSPDGARIAFVGHHEGNPEIYLLEVSTRRLQNISNAPRDDYRPRWSPDGQYVAFLHREPSYLGPAAVHLFSRATGQVSVVSGPLDERPMLSWSPDGRYLHLASRRQYFVYDVDRQVLRELYTLAGEGSIHVVPLPDSRHAALEVLVPPPHTAARRSRVEWVDIVTGQRQHLLNQGTGWEAAPWSPDSARFAFVTGVFPGAILLNTVDVSTRQVHQTAQLEAGWIKLPRWSPDGRLAWVTSVIEQESPTVYSSSLFVSASTDAPPRLLVTVNHGIDGLEWSPTRDHLAFQTYAGIYVADVPSGVVHEFVQGIGKIDRILWSPDGSRIAAHVYGVPNRNGYHAVVVTDINTGRLAVYDPPPGHSYGGGLQWSPDSRYLVFSSGPWGNTDLMMLSACDEEAQPTGGTF